MGKLALVFSGQGDQFPGMGKDIFETYPAARQVFMVCDQLRPGTSAQCFHGPEEELKETKNTQPCLFAVELAAAKALLELGIKPDMAAGFSLGEVSAAAFCGLTTLEEGFELVCKRGELMQEASEKVDSAMAAVLKLSDEKVREIAGKFHGIYPVNFNCPGQVTVSGLASVMPEFLAAVKAEGGRAMPLKVKGAFHSPFMEEAAGSFRKELEKAELTEPAITLYSNLTAGVYEGDFAETLSKQICSPVLWEKLIRNMIAAGADTFIEVGPGRTLTNMIKKIDPGVKVYPVCDMENLLKEVKPC